jgi:iron complex outermembrane recepter protein
MDGTRHPKHLGLGSIPAAFTLAVFAWIMVGQSARAQSVAGGSPTEDLKKLSVEQLMDVEVTSASKTAEPLSEAAAAIYVITHDDIVGSGATSIPEILRLAPNLEVFQVSPSNYIITARGFSGNSADQSFSNKLLVLIDGRSVYSPLYSGVYWDAQDVMIEDIERVEVISGPGATLWGANAVNGVINIITRKSSDTQGALAALAAGNLEKDASARFGSRVDDDLTYRVYAKGFERDALDTPAGASADDGWFKTQAGFRTDWNPGADTLTVQGDLYRGNESQPGGADVSIEGANMLSRWQHAFDAHSAIDVQAFYDQTQRFTRDGGAFVLNTYDIELQDSFRLGSANDIVWGAGDRVSRYDITNTATLLFLPDRRTLNLSDVFAQDSIALARTLKLILGLKFEQDPWTGTTPLPNARLSWKLSDKALVWSAVSRAIRSATPFDRDVAEYLGSTLFLVGGSDFRTEKLTAYELGFRGQAGSALSASVSTYYNVYDDLRTIEITPVTLLPLQWGNGMRGDTYGVELWGNYQVSEMWRLAFGYNEQREQLRFKPGSSGLLGLSQAGDDPSRQASLRSSVGLTDNLTLDADLRYVGSLPDPAVPAYGELNARLAWRVSRRCDIALSGFNLLHGQHEEFTVPPSDAISRSVLVSANLKL